jgi:formamidopyrimidine-DNA glycosylase
MPELPEVEVAARNLRRWAVGRRVRGCTPDPRARRIFRPEGPRALARLAGARFERVDRRGKNLLVTLATREGPLGLWSHLGMTGKWLRRRNADPAPRFSRLDIALDDGTRLHYSDLRLFGRVRLVGGARFDALPDIQALGPDPLADGIDVPALHARLSRLKVPIKVALLDQRLLPGVGNIQASEGLFRARIDPRRPARSLSRAEVGRLARGLLASIEFTLEEFARSGAGRGDGDITYVEEEPTRNPFLVYGRAGAPCPRSGKHGHIERIVQAQRATFFCPGCQNSRRAQAGSARRSSSRGVRDPLRVPR